VSETSKEFLELQAALAGEYSLQRELGRGGMGIVYLARDVQLDRDVAIKLLPAHHASDTAARERFLREARMAAGLSHPNIVPIHRVSEVKGFVFFVMSYVHGETLGDRLRSRGPLPPADASRILREVTWALAYAHGRGIVHRDVKPDNILLEAETGRALVTDFGIASGADDAMGGDPGKVMGTANFMSPEQATGEKIDGRSDIYALGVVAYLTVSGRLPYEAPDTPSLLLKQMSEDAPSVTRVAPGLPSALAAAIDRCLARAPENRFQNGESLAEAFAPAESRPALPATLRGWLGSSNPATPVYVAASAFLSFATLMNIVNMLQSTGPEGSPKRLIDVSMLATLALIPLAAMVGFHVNQARRLFRSGHTLGDLRAAIETADREHSEGEAVTAEPEKPSHRILRAGFYGVGTWGFVTFLLLVTNVIHERVIGPWPMVIPFFTFLGLGITCNVLEIQMLPAAIQKIIKGGLRNTLWRSRLGQWIAKRLGAPERSMLAGSNAFRATEAALGLAAAELFAALPANYKEQLAELPEVVAALEARAAEARAEAEMLAALAPSQAGGAEVLDARKKKAAANLADSVAALEGIRLDLLRVHAGASDLKPLTTLMHAAQLVGDDLNRLAAAQEEVEVAMRDRGPKRNPTSA
jgi:serine/threonine protein kinase